MKIILDIYGGDNSPYAPIDGAIKFLNESRHNDVKIVLSGDESIIKDYLAKRQFNSHRLEILHAPDEVTCHDIPTQVVRQKPNSSMVQALRFVADKNAQGIVSSGSTGALYAGALLTIKRIRGITRPALTPLIPTVKDTQVLLIDSGANADCTPEYLAQFALMGDCYMQSVCGLKKPRIALVNNGTEAEKGNALTRSAYTLLSDMPINFVGNIEAREALSGDADVLVCDGFTGNILLKSVEGTAKAFSTILKQELMSTLKSKIGALLIKNRMRNFKKRLDYRETGGAPLLGINGCVIKAHGSSDATAYMNALKQAYNFIYSDVVGRISNEISQVTDNN